MEFRTQILMRPNYRDNGVTHLYQCQNCNYDLTENKDDHCLISYGVCPNCDANHNELLSFKDAGLAYKPNLKHYVPKSLKKEIDFTKFNQRKYL